MNHLPAHVKLNITRDYDGRRYQPEEDYEVNFGVCENDKTEFLVQMARAWDRMFPGQKYQQIRGE